MRKCTFNQTCDLYESNYVYLPKIYNRARLPQMEQPKQRGFVLGMPYIYTDRRFFRRWLTTANEVINNVVKKLSKCRLISCFKDDNSSSSGK